MWSVKQECSSLMCSFSLWTISVLKAPLNPNQVCGLDICNTWPPNLRPIDSCCLPLGTRHLSTQLLIFRFTQAMVRVWQNAIKWLNQNRWPWVALVFYTACHSLSQPPQSACPCDKTNTVGVAIGQTGCGTVVKETVDEQVRVKESVYVICFVPGLLLSTRWTQGLVYLP